MWPDRLSNPPPLALESYAIGSVDPWLYSGKKLPAFDRANGVVVVVV